MTKSTPATDPAVKTYRVHFTDTRYFYLDVKATDAEQAQDIAQDNIDCGHDGTTDRDAGDYGVWFDTELAPIAYPRP